MLSRLAGSQSSKTLHRRATNDMPPSDTHITASMPLARSKPRCFFDFPLELRYEIYKHIFSPVGKKVAFRDPDSSKLVNKSDCALHAQILRVSRRFLEEAKDSFWRSLILSVQFACTRGCWLMLKHHPPRLSEEQSNLRTVEILVPELYCMNFGAEYPSNDVASLMGLYLAQVGLRTLDTVYIHAKTNELGYSAYHGYCFNNRRAICLVWSRDVASVLSTHLDLPSVVGHASSVSVEPATNRRGACIHSHFTIARKAPRLQEDVSFDLLRKGNVPLLTEFPGSSRRG